MKPILGVLAVLSMSFAHGAIGQTAEEAAPLLPAMVEAPCPLDDGPGPLMQKLLRESIASPGERADIIKSLTPDERAQIPTVVAAYRKMEADSKTSDWPGLCKYQAADRDAAASGRPDVVFMGDSITEFWGLATPAMFNSKIVNRGISGQTTPQMLIRFFQDVVALHPRTVHIMAGTNDIAGNTGPTSPAEFENNIRAMVMLAQAAKITVVLGSILPSDHFSWRRDIHPAQQIKDLNDWLRSFAHETNLIYVDYYSALSDPSGAFMAKLSNDGVHPNRDGYSVMQPLAEAALTKARHP